MRIQHAAIALACLSMQRLVCALARSARTLLTRMAGTAQSAPAPATATTAITHNATLGLPQQMQLLVVYWFTWRSDNCCMAQRPRQGGGPGMSLLRGGTSTRRRAFSISQYTIVAPFASDLLQQAAQRPGQAAAAAEQLKFAESLEYCRQKSLWFVPMAMETFGGWGKVAIRAFRQMSILMAATSGRRASEELRWMYQRHSVALQRDNTRMIIRRADPYVPLW